MCIFDANHPCNQTQLTLFSVKKNEEWPNDIEYPLPFPFRNLESKVRQIHSHAQQLKDGHNRKRWGVGDGQTKLQRKVKTPKSLARILKERRPCFWAIRGILRSQNPAKLGKSCYLKFCFSSMGRKETITSLTLPRFHRNIYEIMTLKLCALRLLFAPLLKVGLHCWKIFPVSALMPNLNWVFDSLVTMRGHSCLKLSKGLSWPRFRGFGSTSYLHSLGKWLSNVF